MDCSAQTDDADHAIFRCDRWQRRRRDLEVRVGRALEPEVVVDVMLESRDNWKAVGEFVSHILSKREEEERSRQREERYVLQL